MDEGGDGDKAGEGESEVMTSGEALSVCLSVDGFLLVNIALMLRGSGAVRGTREDKRSKVRSKLGDDDTSVTCLSADLSRFLSNTVDVYK